MEKNYSDLVFVNGAIYTVDRNQPWAQAVVIKGSRIIFVGTTEGAKPHIGPETTLVDLAGKMILPGFIDAHTHASQAMDLVGNISLFSAESVEEYQQTITTFISGHPERDYYRGTGWSDTIFPNIGPRKEILDAIDPNKPIALVSYDCHSMWVNSVTLEKAGISSTTSDPVGGRIERDPETGEPSGTLRELAFKLVEDVIPDYTIEERKDALIAYQAMASQVGITTVHDPMFDPESTQVYRILAEDGKLKIRFRSAITLDPLKDINQQISEIVEECAKPAHQNFMIQSAKIFVDGVVEGGTAYLLEPYAHKPDFRGEPLWDPELLKSACASLDKEGLQIHLHVIGDAATRITLDALEFARKLNGARDSRHLATHLHLVAPEDISRFVDLGVVGVPQPFWFKVDDYYSELALPYLGKVRADKQYPMKSFIDAGAIMASSSDFPVTIPFDPLIAIQRGVTRKGNEKSTNEVLWPEERATLDEMVASYTWNGAYANFIENDTGSIEVGKQADLVVLERNLFEIPVSEISRTKVLMTMVAGQETFRDPRFTGKM